MTGIFPPPARSIDDIRRNGKAACVSDQAFDNLYALSHGRSKMRQALREITLIEVIRTHSVFYKQVYETFNNDGTIVDAGQKD